MAQQQEERVKLFVDKLYDIVEGNSMPDLISWKEGDGNRIMIHNVSLFAKKVSGLFSAFGIKSFSEFSKYCSSIGFSRYQKKPVPGHHIKTCEMWHKEDLFCKNRPELRHHIESTPPLNSGPDVQGVRNQLGLDDFMEKWSSKRMKKEGDDNQAVHKLISEEMTKISHEFEAEGVLGESDGPIFKEKVEEETTQLSEKHKCLSIRDLASKFDNILAAAAKLSDEAKIRQVASLEGHVLLKKLEDALEHLRGLLAGKNKEDVEEANSMVEALAVKLTQNEGELIQEKTEVEKLASFLKQTSEDAKKLINQDKSFACAEIESARGIVERIGEALEEQNRTTESSKRQDVKELTEAVQESRRIKLMHQPSKGNTTKPATK